MYICRLNENIRKLRTAILKSLIIELNYGFEKNIPIYGLGLILTGSLWILKKIKFVIKVLQFLKIVTV